MAALRHRRSKVKLLAAAVLVLLACSTSAANGDRRQPLGQSIPQRAAFPLKVSADRRYLVDQRKVPFFLLGDSPQALIGLLSVKSAAAYIANRKAAGFDALWVNLLCATYTGCRKDGATFDGIGPFNTDGDLSTPNPKYFARADAIIRLAAKAGVVVLLDPIETGGWLNVLRSNGVAKARAYGRFLGHHYRSFGNIVWFNGNDFQTWRDAQDDALVLAVAGGIRSTDPVHIHTIELNYPTSGSLDDSRWRSLIKLDAAYTYGPTYAEVLHEYNRKEFLPVFMVEAGYEFEQNNSSFSKGDPPILRRQEWWTALSGAAGQLYGNHYTWQFADGWQEHLDTPGSVQLGYLAKLLTARPWYNLVPDQAHTIVTSGFGTFSSTGNVGSSNYVTTAATPNGRLAISYLPEGGTVAVDVARFAGAVQARWYDPTNGAYTPVPDAPFRNGGEVRLTTPGKNADGDRDWVLVLNTS